MDRDDRVAKLHQLAFTIDPLAPRRAGAFQRTLASVAYWLTTLRQTRRYQALFGEYVFKTHGISHAQQRRDLWHCMWCHNQCARHYYWRKLFLNPDRRTWLDNFEHRQVNTMLDYLNAHVPARRLSNKVEFRQHCAEHQLPTPQNLAVWETGGRLISEPPDDPRCDVFIKPTADFGSVGAVAIPYDDQTGTYRLGPSSLRWSELLVAIAETRTERSGYLLQRRLRNSPEAAIYGNDDVCNLRIVTGQPLSGDPVLIAAVMRIPSSFTTQGHDRNVLLSTVDVTNGRMGPGVFRNITLPQFTHHPDTGFALAGRTLPHWHEMTELVTRAHRTCAWMPFVGWDVVDSDQGLILLEANANWGGDSAQLPGAPALGQTRFPEIYLDWFDRLNASARKGTIVGERMNAFEVAGHHT